MTQSPRYLGAQSALPTNPETFELDIIHIEGGGTSAAMLVRLSCPEFTSLCPQTGQPDFAHIVIDYAPNGYLVETKALKLFLGAFRQHGAYHEACTSLIFEKLWGALDPLWMRVSAFWFPRGGIPIDVFVELGDNAFAARVPPIDIPSYRAR